MARATNQDVGKYSEPAQIQREADWADNGEGGNANAGQFVTVRSPMVSLSSGKNGRGASLAWRYGQLYPTADHYAECLYANDVAIKPGMNLLINGRSYQILAAIDENLRHINTIMPCVEYGAKGSV
jgi:hypothetical protein